jgi:hypothetical protein
MNVHNSYMQYTSLEHWTLVVSTVLTFACTVYAMLTVPSEDILKAIKEKNRLEKLRK